MPSGSKLNKDLQDEREKVSFEVSEFTNWYHGGVKNVEEKRFLENYFLSDPELQSEVPMGYLGHKEKYEEAIRRSVIFLKKIRELKTQGYSQSDLISKTLIGPLSSAVLPEANPFVTHFGMFIPTLINFGTPEQQAEWVDRAWNINVIGTYAQTELGHGTFIRGIKTTATYDPQTKEFVINSPDPTAYKWWPGGLGHTCNHAVVFAQLYSLGKYHGLQPFIIQIRDFETHKPMKGVTVGDIGNKVGFGSVNNGFLGFDNVRIPLKNMLMRHSKVLENGEFVKPKSAVLTYGIMTLLRVNILELCAHLMTKSVTIVTRYSLVRRQSPIDPNLPEPKIMEHVTQQMKIFPSLAKAIVFKLTAQNLTNVWNEVSKDIERGNLERLPELHAISCALKAIVTNETVESIQTCRRACGGHGYLNSSGFHDIFGSAAAAQAYEGENTVMLLQTARFLMKAWQQAQANGRLTPTVAYLGNFAGLKAKSDQWDSSPNGILRALQTTAAGKVALAAKHLQGKLKHLSVGQATNQTGIELAAAAEIHCQVFLLQSAIEALGKAAQNVSPSLGNVFNDILEMFAVDLATRYLGDILQFVKISPGHIEQLQVRLEIALKNLRFNAIGIVDGFEITDAQLGSTLGAYDGNVYERLLEAAMKSPLNKEDVNKSFQLYLKPFMKSNL